MARRDITKFERQERITIVARMIANGGTRSEILHFCASEWDLKKRAADYYLAEAREILRQDWDIDRSQMVADLLSQVQTIQRKARKQENLNVALGCINTAAKLAQLIN